MEDVRAEGAPLRRESPGAVRRRLEARYRIDGEYIGAPLVARILGLGRSTVHDQVQAGRFVIPHRLVNRKPLFAVADLADWMAGAPAGPNDAAPEPQAPAAPIAMSPAVHDAFHRLCAERGVDPQAALAAAGRGKAGPPRVTRTAR